MSLPRLRFTAVLIFVIAASIYTAPPAFGADPPDSTSSKTVVITPDYTNAVYTQTAIPVSGLTISDVRNLRTTDTGAEAGAEPFSGASLVIHLFTNDLMKDSYTALVGGRYYGGHWFKNRMGYRFFLDLSGASGTPQRVDGGWEVTSSDIQMSMLSLGGTYLYSLRGDPTKTIFIPFVGAGLQGIFGAEKLSARATWNTVETFETDVWSIRTAFAVHALLATRIRVTDQWRFVLEARWTQSGKGSNLDLKDEAERKLLQQTLYSAVRRSNFDFTGWSIHAGLEW